MALRILSLTSAVKFACIRWSTRLKNHKIGLVPADINIANMDGIEPLTKMRENRQWKLIPVATITTEGSRQRGLAAVDPGAAGQCACVLRLRDTR